MYYPFGREMPGLKNPNGEYRYGFNGMEKDDEVKGSGNSLDFGARIYDSRIGRWMSVDPMAREFSDESPYIFAGNNPVFYLDGDGEIKVTYYTMLNDDGTKTKICKVDKEEVAYKWKLTKATGGNYETYGCYSYDIVENVTLDSKGDVISESTSYEYRQSAFKEFGETVSDFEKSIAGEGGVQGSGFYMITKDGGVDPTQYLAVDKKVEMRDVEDLLTAVGVLNKMPKQLPKFTGVISKESIGMVKTGLEEGQSLAGYKPKSTRHDLLNPPPSSSTVTTPREYVNLDPDTLDSGNGYMQGVEGETGDGFIIRDGSSQKEYFKFE